MSFPHTKKTPVAELGGTRDEGLNPTPIKEQDMHQSTVPTSLDFGDLRLDVDPFTDGPHSGVDITMTAHRADKTRSFHGIVLTPSEARKLASALLDATAPAISSSSIEEIEEHARVARKAVLPMTPAKFAKQMREAN